MIYLERLAPPPAYYLLSSLVSGKTGYLECKNLRDLQGWLKSLESGGQWGISKESSLLGIFRRPWPVCKPDVECLSFRLLRPWRLNLSSMFFILFDFKWTCIFLFAIFSPSDICITVSSKLLIFCLTFLLCRRKSWTYRYLIP